jgi:Putative prokaryotic signal transducing protein
MVELLRSNDPVLLSFADAVLRDADVPHQVVDQDLGRIEGSIGAIQARVLVAADRLEDARRVLTDAGLADQLG